MIRVFNVIIIIDFFVKKTRFKRKRFKLFFVFNTLNIIQFS